MSDIINIEKSSTSNIDKIVGNAAAVSISIVSLTIFSFPPSLFFFLNFREVKYTQNTVMKADVRKLEFEMDNSIFEQNSHQSHRRLAYDCTDGYEGVFENWWNITVLENGEILPPNVTVMTPVDPYEVTYDNVDVAPGNETGPQEPDEGLVKIVIAPENALNLNDVDGLGGGEVGFELFFLLIAYACDENNLPVTTVPPLTQGDTIKICVEPDEKSREYGFVMKQLDSTYYTRDDIPDLIQYAVEGGQPDFWGMSEIDCIPGSLKCSVETTIRAEFFASPGIVSVAGAASFQWDFERRRNLNETVGRDLQAVDGRDVNDEGRFNIVFPLTTFQETMDMKAKGPSSLQSFLLIILSFTLILASIILLWIKDTRRSWTYHNDDDDGCTTRQSMSSHVTPDSSHLKKDMAETYRTESFHDDVHGHLKKDMAETHITESFHYDVHGHLKKVTEETCRTESIHHDVYDDDIDADYCLKLKC